MIEGTPRAERATWRARVVLATFDLLYHNVALYWLASTIPFAGKWRVWQRLALPRIVGRDVLEIGCGPGWLLGDMAAVGYRCRAVDASPQMTRAARATLRRRHIAPDAASVEQARAQHLPFPDESFDTVVSTFPSPYIAEPATLAEVARVLRPGGRLVVVEGANLLPRGPVLWALAQLARLVYGRAAAAGPTEAQLRAALDRHLPLAAAGLAPESEIVTTPGWRAYIITGTKPAS